MDDATWAALTLTLTVCGAIWTWLAFQRRGVASGLRAAAFTLLPLAAYLTQTLRMLTRIVTAVADWATSLVFNPFVWTGVVLAGVSGVLFVVSAFLRSRQRPTTPGPAAADAAKSPGRLSRAERRDAPVLDDDTEDIEALLRRHGIS